MILVERALQAGLAALRQQHAFLGQGVAHADPNVRAASLSQLRRLCASADDVTLLRSTLRPPAPPWATPSSSWRGTRCRRSSPAPHRVAPLRVLLEDGATLGVPSGLGSGRAGPARGRPPCCGQPQLLPQPQPQPQP